MGGMHGMGDYPPGYVIASVQADSSYFTHDGYSSMIVAHIVLMSLAWIAFLPIGM